jgi:hypothetical protein
MRIQSKLLSLAVIAALAVALGGCGLARPDPVPVAGPHGAHGGVYRFPPKVPAATALGVTVASLPEATYRTLRMEKVKRGGGARGNGVGGAIVDGIIRDGCSYRGMCGASLLTVLILGGGMAVVGGTSSAASTPSHTVEVAYPVTEFESAAKLLESAEVASVPILLRDAVAEAAARHGATEVRPIESTPDDVDSVLVLRVMNFGFSGTDHDDPDMAFRMVVAGEIIDVAEDGSTRRTDHGLFGPWAYIGPRKAASGWSVGQGSSFRDEVATAVAQLGDKIAADLFEGAANPSTYAVTLAHTRIWSTAEDTWDDLLHQHPGLRGVRHRITHERAPNGRTLFTLQAVGLSEDEAHRICDSLNRTKVYCAIDPP